MIVFAGVKGNLEALGEQDHTLRSISVSMASLYQHVTTLGPGPKTSNGIKCEGGEDITDCEDVPNCELDRSL